MDKKKDKKIQIRIDEDTRKVIKEAAAEKNVSMTDFLISSVLKEIRRVDS